MDNSAENSLFFKNKDWWAEPPEPNQASRIAHAKKVSEPRNLLQLFLIFAIYAILASLS